ncbi:reverse transcriptase family protein [Staphylococcus aureus]
MEDKSKELITINTHKGLFQYQRLPFGIKSAPGIFQETMDSLTSGLKGCAAYLDDVIVSGITLEEHNENVRALFRRISDYGFRVRKDKCSFAKNEIRFLGHIINREGRKPDPSKVEVIVNMPVPKDRKQLKSFLGMVSYYSSFVPKMRELRGPLDDLEKAESYVWNNDRSLDYDCFNLTCVNKIFI